MSKLLYIITLMTLLLQAMPVSALTLTQGDLIKMDGIDSVYYYDGEKRHPFPNEATYKSWYGDSFDHVITISPEMLGSIPLSKNVTMRPGLQMIKVATDPKTYAVDGKKIRPISTEVMAESLYGSDWAKKVKDISDVFFTNYEMGSVISSTNDYSPKMELETYPTIDSVLNEISYIDSPVYSVSPIVEDHLSPIIEDHSYVGLEEEPEVIVEPCGIRPRIITMDISRGLSNLVKFYETTTSSRDIEETITRTDKDAIILVGFQSTEEGTVTPNLEEISVIGTNGVNPESHTDFSWYTNPVAHEKYWYTEIEPGDEFDITYTCKDNSVNVIVHVD